MQIHVTQSGDTLYTIGKKYGVTIQQLIDANGETVMPTLIIGQAIIIPTPMQKLGSKLINGYAYPNISQNALVSATPYLSTLTPFSYGIKNDGTLTQLNDAQMLAIFNGPALLVVTTLTEEGVFNSNRAAQVLSEDEFSTTLIDNILAKLESGNYFGVDIDFEYIPPEYKNAYTDFISRLREKVSPYGYKVFVSLAPKTSTEQRGLLYEAHDYSALGSVADYVLIMTYEWGYTYGPPMAVAPLDKVETVLQYAVSQIPPEKVLMGIPNYGYDWTLPFVSGSRAESITNTQAITRARKVGANIEFDPVSQAPYYTYYKDGREHIVWFEDARSIKARMELINKLSLAGASIWTVMNFYKPLFYVIGSYFSAT